MSGTGTTWFLRIVKLSNILGFSGHKELKFGDGLQVIEAHNHTGKTSFAIALLWGLTGQLPLIERISAGQFKLKNKQASDKELAEIEITLEKSNGEKFQIRRSTNSIAKKSQLTIKFHDQSYTDDKAQEIILSQLGLKPQSLEGCSIVLQDQRLSLISGDRKRSSEVIHDILGLTMLSKLVPIIKEKLSSLNKLVKDFEERDPIKKWEEHHAGLNRELNIKENEAIEKGYERQIFKSKFLDNEFNHLCENLGIQKNFEERSPKEQVDVIRKELNRIRDQNPYKTKRDQLVGSLSIVNDTLKKIQSTKVEIKEIGKKYFDLVSHYKVGLQEIIPTLQEYAVKMTSKQAALDVLKEQNGLFSHSLSLLRKQECSNACPLCLQSISREALLRDIEAKLGDSIKKSIDEHERDIKQSTQEKLDIGNLKINFTALESNLKRALGDSINSLNALGEKYKDISGWIQQKMMEPLLDKAGEVLSQMEILDTAIQNHLAELNTDYENMKGLCEEFDRDLKPLENKLYNIAMYLIPINDIHTKLLEHDKCKDERLHQSKAHLGLLASTKGYIRQLEELKVVLQTQEKKKANQVIAEHQDFVSRFFVKVADNPHYDRITITAEESHGSVKYDFQASSTKSPNFSDAAKHVLSGGDLSVACLGLMLSLTKGKSNKTGFLVLDDPGESFDMIRMDNFAKEIHRGPSSGLGHQTIILTHQKDFAEKLRQKGAESIRM